MNTPTKIVLGTVLLAILLSIVIVAQYALAA